MAMSAEYGAILRRLPPDQKYAVARQLRMTAWELAAAGLRLRHPELPEEAIQARVRALFLRAAS